MNKKYILIFSIIFIVFLFYNKSFDSYLTLNKKEYIEYSKEIYKGYERLYFIKDDENNIY